MVAIAKPTFKKATKVESKLRLALVGPAGSGKTYTGLVVAAGLVEGTGKRIAVIDSERGSASKYSDVFDFDVLELGSHSPEVYMEAIHAAEEEGYGAILIDSLSHAWMGVDGALEQVDKAAARNRGNSFGAWKDVSPLQRRLIDAMINARSHIVATMRSKTEWVIEENSKGKKEPRKIGLAPVQRDGVEFEFDVVGDIDDQHVFVVTKTRCPALDSAVLRKPGRDLVEPLKAWLAGAPAPAPVAKRPSPAVASIMSSMGEDAERRAEATSRLRACVEILGAEKCKALVGSVAGKTTAEVEGMATQLEDEIARVNAEPPPAEPPVWSEEEWRADLVRRVQVATTALGAEATKRILGHPSGALTGKPVGVLEQALTKLEPEVAKLPPPPPPPGPPPTFSPTEAQLGASILVEMLGGAAPARIGEAIRLALQHGSYVFKLPAQDPRSDTTDATTKAQRDQAMRELGQWCSLRVGDAALWGPSERVESNWDGVIVHDGARLKLSARALAALDDKRKAAAGK